MSKNEYIGTMSELFGVPIPTLRYWEKEGLVNFNRSPDNNYRAWSMRTLRNLCDITFYRKLSLPIKELKQISNLNYEEINNLLECQRALLYEKMESLKNTIHHMDIKLEQVKTIEELRLTSHQFVERAFPAVRSFELLNKDNLTNLINYEKDLIVMFEPECPRNYRYGVFVPEGYQQCELVRKKDEKPRRYLRSLVHSSYEEIEENNLDVCYQYLYEHNCKPGLAMGKVLVSAFDNGLHNYYDTYIEVLPLHAENAEVDEL